MPMETLPPQRGFPAATGAFFARPGSGKGSPGAADKGGKNRPGCLGGGDLPSCAPDWSAVASMKNGYAPAHLPSSPNAAGRASLNRWRFPMRRHIVHRPFPAQKKAESKDKWTRSRWKAGGLRWPHHQERLEISAIVDFSLKSVPCNAKSRELARDLRKAMFVQYKEKTARESGGLLVGLGGLEPLTFTMST